MATLIVKFVDRWETELKGAVGDIALAFGDLQQVLRLTPKRIRHIKWKEWKALPKNKNDAKVMVDGRVKQIKAEYTAVHGDMAPDVEAIIREVREINKLRNTIFHGLWVQNQNTTEPLILDSGRRVPIDVAALTDYARRIRTARDRLNEYQWPAVPKR